MLNYQHYYLKRLQSFSSAILASCDLTKVQPMVTQWHPEMENI